MSGTRKMSKFELDAYVRSRLEEGVSAEDAANEAAEAAEAAEAPWGTFADGTDAPPASGASPTAPVTTDELSSGVRAPRASSADARSELAAATPAADEPTAQTPATGESELDRLGPPPPRTRRSEPPPSDRADHHPPTRPPASGGEVRDEPSIEVRAETPRPPMASSPDEKVEALRTKLARKFTTLAESVNTAFVDFAIGSGAWRVELTAPSGPSTSGGRHALLHLVLRPRRPGFPVLVGGVVNPIDKRAELRDFHHIGLVHEVRFRSALQITVNEWEQFLRKAEVVLNAADIQSQRVPPTHDLIAQSKHRPPISKVAVGVLVVVAVLAVIVLARVWRSLHG